MVVAGVTRSRAGPVSVRRGVKGQNFCVDGARSGELASAVATSGVAMTSLLAMQEVESGAQQDREAQRHGLAVVDELKELQLALLGQGGPDIGRLARLMDRPASAVDPGLAGVLRAVRLRAAIELARCRGEASA